MGNIIDDLDQQLASLNQLKPPGASKGKIGSITSICVSNIQSESNIVQSLYRAVKKASASHKLGTIYAIDSVVRRWIESAKQQGQDLNVDGRGEPGTYPAAIKRVTELMPALFDDVVKAMPAEQKEKLEGMIKIWEKGNTFPPKLLDEFRAKLKDSSGQTSIPPPTSGMGGGAPVSGEKFFAPIPTRPLNTPVGFPPQAVFDRALATKQPAGSTPQGSAPAPAPAQAPPSMPAPAQDVKSILSALASAVPKPAQPPPPPQHSFQQHPAQQPQQQLPANLMALSGVSASSGQRPVYQPPTAPPPSAFQQPQGFPGYLPQPPPSVPQQFAAVPPPQPLQGPSQEQLLEPLKHILPPNILNDQGKLIKALELLQDLQKDNIPMDQWIPVLRAFEQQYQAPAQPPADRGRNWDRDRSRSPDRRRRGSPVYGQYDESTARRGGDENQGRGGGGGGGRNRYRQRSPLRDSPAPGAHGSMAMNGHPMQPKYIEFDPALPRNNIKVLSRTLFVGGAVGTQQEIQELFSRFGQVQTCIANRDKRHAFVKMTTRSHALNAKANLERLQSGHDREVMNIARQTKWGVGFGPRECCDYTKGESVIPIGQLTEADTRWLLEAEYGGTGGQQIESGMVLEEPDIEIGAGVSSKAMSRRVNVDSSGNNQGGGGRRGRDDFGGSGRGGREGKRKNQGGAHQQQHHQQQQQQQQYGYQGESSYGGGGNNNSYGGSGGGGQQMESYGYARPEPVAVATPPAVPGFGFSLPGGGQQR